MANRRCFDIRMVESDRFLSLGKSAQCLYFHLIAHADDDGVCEAGVTLRVVGVRKTALKELETAGFITVLIPDRNVVYIIDWQRFNTIDARYGRPSYYRETLKAFFPNIEVVEFRGKNTVSLASNTCVSQVNGTEVNGTEVNAIEEIAEPPTLDEVKTYAREIGLDDETAKKFFSTYSKARWTINGDPISNWRALMLKSWKSIGDQPRKPKPTGFSNGHERQRTQEEWDMIERAMWG